MLFLLQLLFQGLQLLDYCLDARFYSHVIMTSSENQVIQRDEKEIMELDQQMERWIAISTFQFTKVITVNLNLIRQSLLDQSCLFAKLF